MDTPLWVEEIVEGIARPRRALSSAPVAWAARRASEAVGDLRSELDRLIPPGTIIAFGGRSLPEGWLRCDGEVYECKVHDRLCRAIGTSWGGSRSPAGDAVTFRVPDLRARFLRGVDRGRRDPDRGTTRFAEYPGQNCCDEVGSVQHPELRAHSHAPDALHRYFIAPSAGGANTVHDGDDSPGEPNLWASGIAAEQTVGGSETRPMNANVEYLIKL